jgi:thermolabile hemolysin
VGLCGEFSQKISPIFEFFAQGFETFWLFPNVSPRSPTYEGIGRMIRHFSLFLGYFAFVAIQFFSNCKAELYVFGDSLSDEGNFYLASGGALPPTPLYYEGRFSNGPVWTETLARLMDEPTPNPSLIGGTNYAFNGSRAAGASPYGTPDLMMQVFAFLSENGCVANPSDTFVVWAGANDVFFGSAFGEQNYVPNAVESVEQSVRMLYQAGARKIVVLDLPLLGQTPFFNKDPLASSALNAATESFNTLLARELRSLRRELRQARIADVRISKLFQTASRTPRLFGLRNVTDSATLFDPVSGLGYSLPPNVRPDQYLFWDSIHPTSQGHKIIASYAFLDIKLQCLHR